MKNILLSIKGFENNSIFTYKDSNNFNGCWRTLKEELAKLDYTINTVDENDLKKADYILFQDEVSLGIPKEKSKIKLFLKDILGVSNYALQMREVYKEGLSLGLRHKMVLILWEPAVIDPDNYTEELFSKFDTILTWNDDLVDNKKFFKFYHPYSGGVRPVPNIAFNNKKMLVNISMNKYSSHPNDLYRVRRKSIKFFEKKLGSEFDLFGYNWNKPVTKCQKIFPFLIYKYKNYMGTCEDKNAVLSKYKFSLCYENIKGENGWITEKIFDCFHARTIPIYWGAENITQYIDKNTFIDRRDFKNDRELLEFLESIDENKYNMYTKAIEQFLKSDQYKVFLPENFSKTITKTLKL